MRSMVVAAALAMAPFAPAAQAAPAEPAPLSITPTFAPVLESIRQQPRRRRYERPRDYSTNARGFSQIHAGFFDPEDESANSVLFGFRGGTSFDDRVQLGAGFDWSHRGDQSAAVISETPLPGGGTTVKREELARSSINLVPMMAFLQFTPGGDLGVQPYVGIGGGYEVLFVSAEEFNTGEAYDATFGGWGWQAWGGVGVPLSGRSRLTAEVYLNQSEVEREVDDPTVGARVREIVNVDGAGMRFGVSWGF